MWVENRILLLPSSINSWNSSRISSRATGSSPLVGSSSRKSLAWWDEPGRVNISRAFHWITRPHACFRQEKIAVDIICKLFHPSFHKNGEPPGWSVPVCACCNNWHLQTGCPGPASIQPHFGWSPLPSIVTTPLSFRTRLIMDFRVVVFPAPLLPRNPWYSRSQV